MKLEAVADEAFVAHLIPTYPDDSRAPAPFFLLAVCRKNTIEWRNDKGRMEFDNF